MYSPQRQAADSDTDDTDEIETAFMTFVSLASFVDWRILSAYDKETSSLMDDTSEDEAATVFLQRCWNVLTRSLADSAKHRWQISAATDVGQPEMLSRMAFAFLPYTQSDTGDHSDKQTQSQKGIDSLLHAMAILDSIPVKDLTTYISKQRPTPPIVLFSHAIFKASELCQSLVQQMHETTNNAKPRFHDLREAFDSQNEFQSHQRLLKLLHTVLDSLRSDEKKGLSLIKVVSELPGLAGPDELRPPTVFRRAGDLEVTLLSYFIANQSPTPEDDPRTLLDFLAFNPSSEGSSPSTDQSVYQFIMSKLSRNEKKAFSKHLTWLAEMERSAPDLKKALLPLSLGVAAVPRTQPP